MNPLLSVLFALLATIKPEDVAALVAEAVTFLDPLIAQRGIVLRTAWRFIRPLLSSSSLAADVQGLLSAIKAHPHVATAVTSANLNPFAPPRAAAVDK